MNIPGGWNNTRAMEVARKPNSYTNNSETVRYSFNINGIPDVRQMSM